jgi:tetratricopeptide (TPR) repeat protein
LRDDPAGEAECYLEEVRAVRRYLRQLDKYPRDARLHLELGMLYFKLELGNEALQEWSRAVELEPELAQAHYCLGVEYYFRGQMEESRQSCEKTNHLDPSLPTFEDLRLVGAKPN